MGVSLAGQNSNIPNIFNNTEYANQPIQHPEHLSDSLKKQSSSKEKSFWTTKRVAILGILLLGGAGLIYLATLSTPLPYKTCQGFKLSPHQRAQGLANTLKLASRKACEIKKDTSSKIAARIDETLAERPPNNYIEIENLFNQHMDHSPSEFLDVFATPSCLREDGMLKRDVAYEINWPHKNCEEYIGKDSRMYRSDDREFQCFLSYRNHLETVFLSLQKHCDSTFENL